MKNILFLLLFFLSSFFFLKRDERTKGRPLTNIEITQKYYKTLVASLEKPKDYRSIAINTLKVRLLKRVLENKIHKKKLNAKLERLKTLKAAKAASLNEEAAQATKPNQN